MKDLVEALRSEACRNGGQGSYAWRARELCGKAADAIEAFSTGDNNRGPEICPQCNGSGVGVADTACMRCTGSGGVSPSDATIPRTIGASPTEAAARLRGMVAVRDNPPKSLRSLVDPEFETITVSLNDLRTVLDMPMPVRAKGAI